jgi:hypothetical protein
MCDIVKADVFLAFLLKLANEISFSRLRQLRDQIEDKAPDVIVDVSGPSIALALHYYPRLFEQHGDCIRRAASSASLYGSDYVQDAFLSSMSSRALESLRQAVGDC